MSALRLLADCGNSRVKLGVARAGGIWLHERVAPRAEDFDAFLDAHGAAVEELIVLPTAAAGAAAVRAWWARAGRGRRMRVIGEDLPLPDLGQYACCGADRVLAGLVACAQERTPLVVLDCGTAPTITAWRHDGGTDPLSAVRFAGGLILPGVRACAAGLHAAAPALPAVEPAPRGASALQRDTRGALAAALAIGHPAMVRACLDRVAAESGIAGVICTGGGAAPLLGDVVPRRSYRPALVLEGMELLAGRSDGGTVV